MDKIKVLIVDDSALVRKIISTGISKDPNIEVVGQAPDPYVARDLIIERKPDVITLDIEMPRMDGVTFLKKFIKVMPIPTIIVSSLSEQGKKITLEALEAGAVDFVTKPKMGVADQLPQMMGDLTQRIKTASRVNMQRVIRSLGNRSQITKVEGGSALEQSTDLVIALGSSTGGIEALNRVLPALPPATPGIVITQHIPAGFSASLAERMDAACQMQVREAKHGDRIRSGLVLIAPGGEQHMKVVRSGGRYHVELIDGERVSHHRPSVTVLFESVAKYVGKNAIAGILTGMGSDGAEGLLDIHQAGGKTFVQDEATSVVYGMPKAAFEKGATNKQIPLERIALEIITFAKEIAIV